MSIDEITSSADLYRFLRETGSRLVSNIIFAGSPGHQIQELDNYLRMRHLGEIPDNIEHIWIQPPGDITESLAQCCSEHFASEYGLTMKIGQNLYGMAAEISRLAPELCTDVGVSHLKFGTTNRNNTYLLPTSGMLFYYTTHDTVVRTTKEYYIRRQRSLDFNPWTKVVPPLDGAVGDMLGNGRERYALLHFRQSVGNAGIPVAPEAMFATFEYLRDNGYAIVMAGTEPYPEDFERFGVINYSQSPLRCFRNDMALLSHAKLAIINASGLENLPEIMGVPTVSYGRWHVTMVPFSSKLVILPVMLYSPRMSRLLTFAEHMLFFKSQPEIWESEYFGWHFPADKYIPRPPQADEVLAAVKEALALGEADRPLSPMQQQFNKLDMNGCLSVVQSRVSQFFLERFEAALSS